MMTTSTVTTTRRYCTIIGVAVPPTSVKTSTADDRDFYAAQRAFLELRKHLGEERADKFHGR